MVNVKVYLRGKVREKWFMDLANEIRDEFGELGTWTPSEQGFVWTHKRHGGKVRFLRKYDDFDGADFVRSHIIAEIVLNKLRLLQILSSGFTTGQRSTERR